MEKTCDHCDKPAVANFQKMWVRWKVYRNGDYSKTARMDYDAVAKMNEWDEPTGENNIHVCAEHEEKLLNGELDF